MELRPANDKLYEAEYFFTLMEKHFHHYEFRYFLSTFLSALFSCTEHNWLMSADPRFKEWYQEMRKTHMSHSDLRHLQEMRKHEVHLKGKQTLQVEGFSFPDGIEVKGGEELIVEVISGQSVGRYKTTEMEEFKEYPVEQRWVWMTKGEPDVMDLCSRGLAVAREIIKSRDAMGFPD
jgi:hypothetical protein